MKRFLLLYILYALSLDLCARRAFTMSNSANGESELMVFLPDTVLATGKAVVCCPGGGYTNLCSTYEGTDWAPYYNAQGIAYAVLKYRMPHGNRQLPIADACNALKTMRDSASSWHINRHDVGIMGFSAGGHLAATVATQAPMNIRPDFQILFYPVISMDVNKGHRGSSVNFLGADLDKANIVKQFSAEQNVHRHLTPPAILFMAGDDRIVDPYMNGVAYYSALRRNDVPASIHIYPTGGHGWHFDNSFTYHDAMLSTLTTWLQQQKAPASNATRVACIGNSITDGDGLAQRHLHAYPAQLQQLLGDDFLVKNFGVSGRTMLCKGSCQYMREQAWQDCKDFNPEIVIIKLGTNDSKTNCLPYLNEFEKDMQQMIDELKALSAKPQIMLGLPAKAWKSSWTISDSIIANRIIPAIKHMAKKNRLPVIDFHALFSSDEKLMQDDGVHPTAQGAAAMAEEARSAILEQLLKGELR